MSSSDRSWQSRESELRAPWLSGVLIVVLAVLGLADLQLIDSSSRLAALLEGEDQQAIGEATRFFDQAALVVVFATATAYLFFIWWLAHRSAQLNRLRVAGQEYSPGWVVVALFLPGLSAFLPYRIVAELWRSSQSPVDFSDTRAWRGGTVGALVGWWWFVGVVATIFWALWFYGLATVGSGLPPELERIDQFLQITLVACATQLSATVLTFLLTLALDRRQLQRFREVQDRYVVTKPAASGIARQGRLAAGGPLSAALCLRALGMGAAFQALFLLLGAVLELPPWWYFISTQLALLAVALTIARSEGVTLRRLAAIAKPRRGDLLAGLLTGIGALGLALFLLVPKLERFAGARQDRLQEMTQVVPGLFIVLTILIVAPLVEEILFRGVLFEALSSALPPAAVVVLTAGLFAVVHGNLPQMIATFVLGIHCGLARAASGSVWPAVLIHFLNNLGAMLVYPLVETRNDFLALGSVPFMVLLVVGYGLFYDFYPGELWRRGWETAVALFEHERQLSSRAEVLPRADTPRAPEVLPRADTPRTPEVPPRADTPRTPEVPPRADTPRTPEVPPRADTLRALEVRDQWDVLRAQLWGGPVAHGLAVALAIFFSLQHLMGILSGWRSVGAVLFSAAFFGFWAWAMWSERKAHSAICLVMFTVAKVFSGLLYGFNLRSIVVGGVFLSGTLAVFRGHPFRALPSMPTPAPRLDPDDRPAQGEEAGVHRETPTS